MRVLLFILTVAFVSVGQVKFIRDTVQPSTLSPYKETVAKMVNTSNAAVLIDSVYIVYLTKHVLTVAFRASVASTERYFSLAATKTGPLLNFDSLKVPAKDTVTFSSFRSTNYIPFDSMLIHSNTDVYALLIFKSKSVVLDTLVYMGVLDYTISNGVIKRGIPLGAAQSKYQAIPCLRKFNSPSFNATGKKMDGGAKGLYITKKETYGLH